MEPESRTGSSYVHQLKMQTKKIVYVPYFVCIFFLNYIPNASVSLHKYCMYHNIFVIYFKEQSRLIDNNYCANNSRNNALIMDFRIYRSIIKNDKTVFCKCKYKLSKIPLRNARPVQSAENFLFVAFASAL